MYIAKKAFVADNEPHLDLTSGNWVIFDAPKGILERMEKMVKMPLIANLFFPIFLH